MYRKGLLALAVASTALACINVVPGDHYTVYLDPAFSASEQKGALAALQDWTNKIPELTLTPVVGECAGIQPGVICLHRGNLSQVEDHGGQSDYFGVTDLHCGTQARGDTGGWTGVDGGETWFDMSYIYSKVGKYPTIWQATVEHEVGHAMGLVHHSGYALMHPGPSDNPMVANCDDIAQWHYVRYMSAPACQ